ncbi:MAG: hypothetical protein LBO63_03220 [Oscillospiraceae bacterium]|jgi:hypothetical protein|nr:hypothetical protein [Oscillospiraceae bacterium]
MDWDIISDDKKPYFLEEANAEITHKHPLYNRILQPLERRHAQDDVLFSLADGNFAAVHLTYSHNNADGWPKFTEFVSLEEARKYIAEYLTEEE